jgi:thiosulfate dehydrogenase (quinone) large subunit
MTEYAVKTPHGRIVSNPPLARLLFDDTRFAVVWLIVRVLLGLTWLNAASAKLGDPAWMQTGEALKAFWTNAVKVPDSGKPPITFDWYRNLIQYMLDNQWYVWFAKLVAIGEFVVGICLILGLFVGIAAFFGAFMNWNYLMAGSSSTNPILFVAALLLMFAWKTAGYYGLDRFIVPRLGATWEDEDIRLRREKAAAERTASPPKLDRGPSAQRHDARS